MASNSRDQIESQPPLCLLDLVNLASPIVNNSNRSKVLVSNKNKNVLHAPIWLNLNRIRSDQNEIESHRITSTITITQPGRPIVRDRCASRAVALFGAKMSHRAGRCTGTHIANEKRRYFHTGGIFLFSPFFSFPFFSPKRTSTIRDRQTLLE